MRLLAICLLATLVGCTTTRTFTIAAHPEGARIEIDSNPKPRNPGEYEITWESDADSHNVSAELDGYKPQTIQLSRDDPRSRIDITLKKLSKAFTVNTNVAATISIDGKPVSADRLSTYHTPVELDMSRDPKSAKWVEHKITAEREGFQPASDVAAWRDGKTTYDLVLKPMEKEMSITTTPTGANLYFDGEWIGTSPLDKFSHEFPYDVNKEQYLTHKLKATLPGYPDNTIDISYDDGQPTYHIDFVPSNKSIHIHTEPPGAIVTLEGHQYKPESNGDTVIPSLSFPPDPEKHEQKVYTGSIHKPKTEEKEWRDKPIAIAWDDGQPNYSFTLEEIRTMPLPLLSVEILRGDNGWIIPKTATSVDTIASKSIVEPDGQKPIRLTPPELRGKNIDALAISPDGKKLLFSVLMEKPEPLHSLMYVMPADGSGAPVPINDGRSLDVTPSFSPDGEQILFSSDRSGNRMIISAMSALGGQQIEQYTMGQTTDWWPSMDSSAKPRIFYEARSDRPGANPTICWKYSDTTLPADLNVDGGLQPRINPQNDTVLYEHYNEKTLKRDIWRMSDAGGNRINITNSPDADDYDASWDRIGARIAYASDAGVDPNEKRPNYDIWVLDVTQPNAQPQRITSNASYDDHPVWNPSGKAIYFRSNRGGEWGIWKINLK